MKKASSQPWTMCIGMEQVDVCSYLDDYLKREACWQRMARDEQRYLSEQSLAELYITLRLPEAHGFRVLASLDELADVVHDAVRRAKRAHYNCGLAGHFAIAAHVADPRTPMTSDDESVPKVDPAMKKMREAVRRGLLRFVSDTQTQYERTILPYLVATALDTERVWPALTVTEDIFRPRAARFVLWTRDAVRLRVPLLHEMAQARPQQLLSYLYCDHVRLPLGEVGLVLDVEPETVAQNLGRMRRWLDLLPALRG